MEGTSSGPPATVSTAELAAQITELVRVAHALEQLPLMRALEAVMVDVPSPGCAAADDQSALRRRDASCRS